MEPVGVLLVLFAVLAVLLLRGGSHDASWKGSTESTRDQTVAHCRPLWWPTIDPPIPRASAATLNACVFLP